MEQDWKEEIGHSQVLSHTCRYTNFKMLILHWSWGHAKSRKTEFYSFREEVVQPRATEPG